MKKTTYLPPRPTFTLPEQLNKFTEEAAEDIKTPKIKDFLLSRLKEDAWNRYQNELQNGFDKDQAQTRTLKDLGDIQTVKARLLKEAEEQKNQENSINPGGLIRIRYTIKFKGRNCYEKEKRKMETVSTVTDIRAFVYRLRLLREVCGVCRG